MHGALTEGSLWEKVKTQDWWGLFKTKRREKCALIKSTEP